MTGKNLTDPIDVWVRSLGRRARKKATYLKTMADWHKQAKAKYKNRLQLFLRRLDANNTSHAGELLHATPYATIEKIDPYHRQTFVFLDPNEALAANDQSQNEMGVAFLDYLGGNQASTRDTNGDASFYEWLEYHPFCIGTPGVLGDARFKSPARISYEGHDVGLVYLPNNGPLSYSKLLSAPSQRFQLNTADFGKSGKGPTDACTFVWDRDGNLLLHKHGDGFVHASAKQGKKVRCAGMIVGKAGKVTCVTNQSGHYATNIRTLYNFAWWLDQRGVFATGAELQLQNTDADGTYDVKLFLKWGTGKYGVPPAVDYLE